MNEENKEIYKIENAGPMDAVAFKDYPFHTIGYASGAPDDIRRFYEATGVKVRLTSIRVPHITEHDANERVRLEDLLKGTTTIPGKTTRTIENEVMDS